MAGRPANMGLQLFPSPPKPAKNARQAVSPQSPEERPAYYDDGRQSAMGGRETPQQYQSHPSAQREVTPITVPPPAAHVAEIPRSYTSLSEAPTLVQNDNSQYTPPRGERAEPVLRSIFPRYNPDLPLEHQPYYPTQASPTQIPRAVVNRRPYSPSLTDRGFGGLQSPMPVGPAAGRFPQGLQDETILEPSNNEELKELWKVTNGWRVSASEGRRFCLRMTSALEEPVHTLSSTTQTFYKLRLDPTSTSAIVTMTRQDPNKPSGSPKLTSPSSKNGGMDILTTTLEESARRLPPNDGLVAVLYPKAASNMAVELANKSRGDAEQVLAAAERECGRLVWDEDSKKYYLVHPAVATPFYISIHSTPAWSRSEYTLEHPELPQNLIRLSRDGAAGTGYLEIDTGVASRIDCFYIVDVAICAVLLVAIQEEKNRNLERFEAPPSIAPASPISPKIKEKKEKKDKKKKDVRIEEFELDLESQNSLKEPKKKGKDDKVPGFFGLIWMMIKCFVWTFVMFFKGLAKIIIWMARCCTSKKNK